MPQIEWVGTPNYRAGRNGRKPIAIVNHITAGAYPGCLEWMQNPSSQVSAHYLILKNGRILQLVKEEDTAWHAGKVNKPDWPLYDGTNPNSYTIGIEHEGADGSLTEEQYQATLWLQKQIVKRWNIPIDVDHIIGHYRIDSVNRRNCPGAKFPWERLFKDLKKEDDVLKHAILLNTGEDFWAGSEIARKLGCAMFLRLSDKTAPEEAKKSEHLIVVGGGSVGHKNETLLSGADKFGTAAEVKKYLATL